VKRRIIFLIESPLCQRDYERYGIDIFLRNNFYVLVWDFTPVSRSVFYKTFKVPDPIKFDNNSILKSRKKIVEKLSSIRKSDVIVCMIRHSLKHHFVFQELINSECYFGAPYAGTVPKVGEWRTATNKVKSLIYRAINNPFWIIDSFYDKYYLPLIIKKQKFQYVIYGGWASRNSRNDSSIDYINAHALDYDLYLANIKEEVYHDEVAYAVFLDEFVPFHPDNIGREIDATEENYYPDLNRFFSEVEKQFNLKVIIAAHPRSSYSVSNNPFNGRKIVFGKTISLIKYADLVLTHASTANNFTVLYSKPVLFVNSSKYSKYFQSSIKSFAIELNKIDIDISSNYQLEFNDCQPEDEIFTNYRQKYIKDKNSQEIPFWNIFINHLNSRVTC
jgi:hypothetical protein